MMESLQNLLIQSPRITIGIRAIWTCTHLHQLTAYDLKNIIWLKRAQPAVSMLPA